MDMYMGVFCRIDSASYTNCNYLMFPLSLYLYNANKPDIYILNNVQYLILIIHANGLAESRII